jgi:DNA topoisomerase-2
LVPAYDFAVLTYRDDDGLPVEPEWYAPILPMLLINGARGIGTGYSTFIPSFNPAQLKSMILKWLETGTGLDDVLVPWVRGFTGTIQMEKANECVLSGKLEGDTITELPVGTWTADVREKLDELVKDGKIRDYTDMSTDMTVCIKLKVDDKTVLDKILKDKWKLTNMHAFDSKCVIRKYATPNEILKEFVDVRLDLYSKRRDAILKALKEKLPYHENVVRFIRQQCEEMPRPDLRRKTPEECDRLLGAEKFVLIRDCYDYLMNLPISALTLKNAQKYENEFEELKKSITDLENTTPKQMWVTELKALVV